MYGVTEDELGNIWIATETVYRRLLVNSDTFIALWKVGMDFWIKGVTMRMHFIFLNNITAYIVGKTMACIRFNFESLPD